MSLATNTNQGESWTTKAPTEIILTSPGVIARTLWDVIENHTIDYFMSLLGTNDLIGMEAVVRLVMRK